MADSRVTDRDLGYQRTMQALAVLTGTGEIPKVLVGVRSASAGSDMVRIAAANEFGSLDGKRPPERSFLRSTADENRARYADSIQRAVTRTLDGADLEAELGRVGLGAVADVQKKMVDLKTPKNAPSTIKRKGVDNPLIESARLKNSIDHLVKGVSSGKGPGLLRSALGLIFTAPGGS